MRFWSICLLLGAFVTACGTSKDAVVPANVVDAADYPYIEKFHEGVRFKVKGQLQDAVQAFEVCLAQKPNDDAVIFALAQCYLLLNDRSKAAEFTERAAKIDPKNIWYTQELAYMYFEQSRFEESAACFQKMVAKEPKNTDWWFGYAEVLKRLNKRQEAIDAYTQMEDQLGVIPDLSIQKFDLYRQLKQDEKGLKELDKARKMYPDDINLLGTYIDYYFEKRQIDKARDMLVELVKADPNNGRANLALGELYMRDNKKAQAYPYFKAAFTGEGVDIDTKMDVLLSFYEQQPTIEPEVFELADLMVIKHPEDAKSYTIQGDLFLKNSLKEDALSSYREALKFDESKYDIWYQVLMLEYQQSMFADLYKDARACSALFPTLANVQLLYTIACVQTGRYQEAIDAADIGKELVINDPITEAEFYAQKGEALFLLKSVKEGIENYDKAMALDPANQLTKNNFAMRLALANEQLDRALKMIDEINSLYPKQAPFSDTKGMVLFQQGNYTEAYKFFELANQLQPHNRNYVEHVGDALFKLGDVPQAVLLWNEAKSLGSANKSLDKKIQNKTYYAPVY
ncbi:MAG TPA: tetratricopeptide repeat protein [Fluviicola sp.]|nr:tetratricopeptide repeat protein [Fluviicola sp.]